MHKPALTTLTAGDFPPQRVSLVFEDGSRATFRYAFFEVEGGFTVVYTEHCGYHSFPTNSLKTITIKPDTGLT